MKQVAKPCQRKRPHSDRAVQNWLMAEWLPPQLESGDGHEYLAKLLVISTPDGFTSRWEDAVPRATVRSEVSQFARRMSTEDFTKAERIDPPPHLRELIEQLPVALGDDEGASAARRRPIPPDEKFGRVVFLRLMIRDCTAEQKAAGCGERAIDFEFGPMGAPPRYPRVSVNDLFRHAAETA
jgi:hypothetical protein